MRVLTPIQSAFVNHSSDGNTQVVSTGNLAVLRAFSATPDGLNNKLGEAVVKFRDGTVTGDVKLTYQVPYVSIAAAVTISYGVRTPCVLIPIPGIGIRFENGMNVELDVQSLTLSVEVQVFYT